MGKTEHDDKKAIDPVEPLPAHTIGRLIPILFDVRTAVSKRNAKINETSFIITCGRRIEIYSVPL